MDLIAFQFEHGTMMFTEASSKKRASLHIIGGDGQLDQFRARRSGSARVLAGPVPRPSQFAKPHTKTRLDRPDDLFRNWKRVFQMRYSWRQSFRH